MSWLASIAPADVPWEIVGWTANVCYFSRFFLQWIASERASESVAPASFWWLSLAGVVCFGAYAHHRSEPVMFAGAVVNGLIYVRNLMLAHGLAWFRIGTTWTSALAIAALWFLVRGTGGDAGVTGAWLAVGIVGQTVWTSRFVVQWWCAERARRAHFPRAFWWTSLAGNALLLAYCAHLQATTGGAVVFIAGFLPGPLVQIRNLMLSYRRESIELAAGESAPA